MGIIDKLIDGYINRKGLNPNQNVGITGINGMILQDYDSQAYINEGFLGNADVYSVVSFLARKAASIPWYVYKIEGGEKAKSELLRYKQLSRNIANKGALEQALISRKNAFADNMVMDNDLARLLERPNKGQAQDQFLENLFGYRLVSGEGNIFGNDGGVPGGKFVEMNILPTNYLDIYPDPNDLYGITGYRLSVGNGINIPKDNVCQWKTYNLEFDEVTRSHLRGLSPLRAAYKTLRMANNAVDASASMTRNGGSKGALVPSATNGPNITPEQASQIMRGVNDRLNNTDSKGSIGVLQTPWDYLNFGLSSVDMELLKAQQFSLHQWCRVFGMPIVLFDADSSSYNNYQNALRDLITNTIMPLCCSLRDELNMWLAPRYGNDLYIDFDITALPELQSDMAQLVTQLKQADWLTYDEKRTAMNYEEKGGAYQYSYVNQGIVPLEQIMMDLSIPQEEMNGNDNGNDNGSGDMDDSDESIS